MNFFVFCLCVVAMLLADVRWLRVAQREHYLAGSVSRFVVRWAWESGNLNRALVVIALVGLIVGFIFPSALLLVAIAVAVGPIGLGLKGRTSSLAFTRRLKTLAALVLGVQILVIAVPAVVAPGGAVLAAALMAILAPTVVDLATGALAPWEKRKAEPFVQTAKARLKAVGPMVIGITGSYGKTTTKNYLAHILSTSSSVLATPASFNNRAGLSRAINEQLSPGTDIFIAEMGTYGFGEIAELCELCPPQIAIITSIGPVHLERFGSEAAIVQAKAEIFEKAHTCVLNVDDDRLAFLADELQAQGKTVWRCSAIDEQADVRVQVLDGAATVSVRGEVVAVDVALSAPPTNVACAVAVAVSLGLDSQAITARLSSLPSVAHRQEVSVTNDGATIIDDTYNANPTSVRRALNLLRQSASEGARRVVVTPGIVELGRRQPVENFSFARDAAESATDIVIVGRTNRRALRDGATASGLNVVTVAQLPEAVDWVKNNTKAGDAVLYANDLPDHFP